MANKIILNKKNTFEELPQKIKEDRPDVDAGFCYKLIPCLCVHNSRYIFLWLDHNSLYPTWLDGDMGNTFCDADEIDEYYILPELK